MNKLKKIIRNPESFVDYYLLAVFLILNITLVLWLLYLLFGWLKTIHLGWLIVIFIIVIPTIIALINSKKWFTDTK